MIDYEYRLSRLREYLDYQLGQLSLKYIAHYRVISDVEFRFPLNYELVNHDRRIELSKERWFNHKRNGWGEPDKMLGEDIELRYLWKKNEPISFDDWLLKNPKKQNG